MKKEAWFARKYFDMSLLHRISKASPFQTLFGKLLRLPVNLIPRDARVRILSGPLRGYRWIAG